MNLYEAIEKDYGIVVVDKKQCRQINDLLDQKGYTKSFNENSMCGCLQDDKQVIYKDGDGLKCMKKQLAEEKKMKILGAPQVGIF